MALTIPEVYEKEDLMGPGWLMFFTNTVRVIPAKGGAGAGAAAPAKKQISELTYIHQDLNLDEDDLSDIIILLALSGLLDQ
jgi:hypothetical protein